MSITPYPSSNGKENSRFNTLRLLLANHALSRTEIAAALNISTAAVTMTTKSLLDEGIVIPYEVPYENQDHSRVGRRQSLLTINPRWKYILAIEIFPENINLAITDLLGDTVSARSFSVPESIPSLEEFFGKIAGDSHALIESAGLTPEQMLGAGVSMQGDVDPLNGIALNPYILKGPVPVRKLLASSLQMPIAVESNVCTVLQSELTFRNYIREHNNVLMLKWGPGVGSAMAINGNIYKGYRFQSPEIGHNSFSRGKGIRCRCGRRGCLETVISEQAMVEKLKRLLASGKDDSLPELAARYGPPSSDNFLSYITSDRPSLRKLVRSFIEKLVNAVNNAVIILAPEKLVLYGQFFKSDTLFQEFNQSLMERNPILPEHFCVRNTVLSQKPYIGCAAIAMEQILFSDGISE